VSRPLQFDASVRLKHHFRYIDIGSGTTFNITRGNLLNLMVSANTTSTAARLIAGIKLNRIEMFTTASSTSGSSPSETTISVEWLSNYGPSSESSDSSISVSLPAHVTSRPPPNSLASFWSLTGSNESEIVAKLQLPSSVSGAYAYTIVDIWVDVVLMDDETPLTVTGYTNTLTLSQFYLGYLDGNGSSAEIKPVSYVSIK
jgi:hypothetical protein